MSSLKEEEKRNLYLFKRVDSELVQELVESIHKFNDYDDKNEEDKKEFERKPIKLHISTYGGSVYSGFGLVDTIINSKTPIHTFVNGYSMSMGLLIGAVGHKRFAHKNATFMYHEVSSGAWGKITDLKVSVDEVERLGKLYIKLLQEHTQFTESIKDIKTDLFFTADEALNKYGLIDQIIE